MIKMDKRYQKKLRNKLGAPDTLYCRDRKKKEKKKTKRLYAILKVPIILLG